MKRSPLEAVQAQLDAYNRKDIDALVGTYAQDAEQFTLHGELIAVGQNSFVQGYCRDLRSLTYMRSSCRASLSEIS